VLDAATLTGGELAAAPTFVYEREAAAAAVRRLAPSIAGMIVAAALLLWSGFRSYRRYEL
jgi:hypothetical protein